MLSASHIPPAECTFQSLPNAGRRGGMVFLAAVVPRPGVSVIEQFRADPLMFNPAWVGQNPLEDKVALDFVYHDCPPDRIDWAMSTRLMFYAKRALEEPCPLRAWPRSEEHTSELQSPMY